jgi:hypothetical protein
MAAWRNNDQSARRLGIGAAMKRGLIAATAVVLFWAGFAYDVSRPADQHAYRRLLLQAAEAAHDAAQTGRLVGEQQLAGRLPALFATTAYDDAATALAGAQQKFASQGPPDETSAASRDRLAPLLQATVRALGDTAEAAGNAGRRAGVARLGGLARQLDDFVTAQRS